ncbi:hypothetical protein H8K29_10515 [Undibacterium sp. CY21W]|nr:hypothetical protein [Undibacterium sp. CY21W]
MLYVQMNYRPFILFVLLSVACMTGAFADGLVNFTLPSGVAVELVEQAFVKSQFKVEGCNGQEKKCLINGRIPFGTDLDLPKSYVKSIRVSFQGKTYSLSSDGMYNAWGKRPLEYPGSVRYFGGKCFDSQNCQFRGLFSDAAGSFVAEWRVVNGVPTRTVLTNSNDVVSLFMKHIDPPEFE